MKSRDLGFRLLFNVTFVKKYLITVPAKNFFVLRELSGAISEGLAKKGYQIDQSKIAVAGHSIGGYSALAIAGAQFDSNIFQKFSDLLQKIFDFFQVQSFTFPSIKAIVSMEGACGDSVYGTFSGSFVKVDHPVLFMYGTGGRPANRCDATRTYLQNSIAFQKGIYQEIAYPDAAHIDFSRTNSTYNKKMKEDLGAFLDKFVK